LLTHVVLVQGDSSSDESGEDFEMDLDSDLGLNAEDGSDEEGSDDSSSDSMHDRNRASRAASQQVAQLHWRMANKTTQFAQVLFALFVSMLSVRDNVAVKRFQLRWYRHSFRL
jgi:lipopolysaccharide export LptBFGC system permease protein LptF